MALADRGAEHQVVAVSERYASRPVSALGTWRCGDWRIKKYAIAYARETPRPELVAAAEATAADVLPTPAVTATRYGVGFLGIHDGRGGNFVFVDWWEQENELHHHVFFSRAADPGSLRAASAGDPIACVWDLSVIAHEHEAWLRHVLAADVANLEAYLEDQLSGAI
jgi:hypothetical protein